MQAAHCADQEILESPAALTDGYAPNAFCSLCQMKTEPLWAFWSHNNNNNNLKLNFKYKKVVK